jgi:hypothetical protein
MKPPKINGVRYTSPYQAQVHMRLLLWAKQGYLICRIGGGAIQSVYGHEKMGSHRFIKLLARELMHNGFIETGYTDDANDARPTLTHEGQRHLDALETSDTIGAIILAAPDCLCWNPWHSEIGRQIKYISKYGEHVWNALRPIKNHARTYTVRGETLTFTLQ